jgi:hypothetical protein
LNKAQTKTEDVKLIIDKLTVIYNAKLADDKKRDGGGAKKGKLKPKINAGKAVDAIGTRNNNTAMVADLVGSDDEDYGEYGEEYPVAGSKREAEGDYDFM